MLVLAAIFAFVFVFVFAWVMVAFEWLFDAAAAAGATTPASEAPAKGILAVENLAMSLGW